MRGLGRVSANRLPGDEGAFNSLYLAYRTRARIKGHVFEISKDEFKRLAKQLCHFCGTPPATIRRGRAKAPPFIYNGLDRLDSKLGYTLANVVTCCGACNFMKRTDTVSSFLARVAAIHKRRKKIAKLT